MPWPWWQIGCSAHMHVPIVAAAAQCMHWLLQYYTWRSERCSTPRLFPDVDPRL